MGWSYVTYGDNLKAFNDNELKAAVASIVVQLRGPKCGFYSPLSNYMSYLSAAVPDAGVGCISLALSEYLTGDSVRSMFLEASDAMKWIRDSSREHVNARFLELNWYTLDVQAVEYSSIMHVLNELSGILGSSLEK